VTGARVPIFDNHVHLRPDGDHVAAALRFEAAGGTHCTLVHSPHDDFTAGVPDWPRAFDRTVATAAAVRDGTGLKVWVALGPYPVHLVRMAETLGLDAAKAHMLEGATIAAEYVAAGHAVAIGEVGRPHFDVPPVIREASNEVLLEVMRIARSAGCPVILHTETADPAVMQDLAGLASRANLPPERVIKHYAAPLVLPAEHHGLFPSIIASRKHIRRAAEACPEGRWFLETDYIDDHARPNVVMPVDTIPRRVKGFLQSGELTVDMLHRSGVEWVERLYGVETGF
jgi:TatD-related deoxyribonuclease